MDLELPVYDFCPSCGGAVKTISREGRLRPVCTSCGFVVYVNPYPAVCLVVRSEGRVLLGRRSIEPHFGEWCLPGGFMEWGESPEDTARRELVEETGIRADALSLVGVYSSITGRRRHVVLVAYLVPEWSGDVRPGDDVSETGWFAIEGLPRLAFPVHERVIADIRKMEAEHADSRG